ncbi:MAG TPA: MFS transporter [Stellaceae bacterium]|nr:MFS transporter [Stellaceae bacterium]
MDKRSMRRRGWGVTALLFFFMYINFADKAVIGLAAVPMMRDLALTPVQWGLVGSSFFYLFPVSALAVGFIVNHVPARWALLVMGVVWALTQFPMLGAASFALLIACRVALGAGEGPAFPVALHALYTWFPDADRPLPTSILAIGSAVGVFTAAPVLVWIIAAISWHAAFGLLGVLGLVWAAAWGALGAEGPLAAETESDTRAGRIPYRTLLTSPTVIGVLITGMAVYWSLALLVAWVPAFLQQGLGYHVAPATVMVTLTWGAVAVILPCTGGVSQRWQRAGATSRLCRGVPAGLFALVSGTLSMAALLLPTGPWQLALLVLGYSLGGAIFTLGPTMIGEITPPAQRSAVLGITSAVQTAAGMIAPAVTGSIIAAGPTLRAGYLNAFMLAGAIAAAGGLAGLLLMRPEADVTRLARE